MKTKVNLATTNNGWFYLYKGFVYANKPTPIHARISNKALIERGNVKTVGGRAAYYHADSQIRRAL